MSSGPRRRVRQLFKLYDHAINGPTCAEIVRGLMRAVRGPVDLVWDRLSAHLSPEVRAEITRRPRLRVHLLPAYAPELNPVEGMWSSAKASRLRGVAADDEIQLRLDAQLALEDIGGDQALLRSFIRHTPLRIPGISS